MVDFRNILSKYQEIIIIIIAILIFYYLFTQHSRNSKEGFDPQLEGSPFPAVLMDPAKYFLSGYRAPQYADPQEVKKAEDYPGERATGDMTESGQVATPSCRECSDLEPNIYNEREPEDSVAYAQAIIERQGATIKNLQKKLKNIALNEGAGPCNTMYRRKLSNKYYRPQPFLAHPGIDNLLNLNDDDFSNKTLSTIKFLSQTRPSKYFGSEVHFPTELCGNYCSTSDPNAQYHEQIDLVRPITPVGFIPPAK
jgi:hypothetical protein